MNQSGSRAHLVLLLGLLYFTTIVSCFSQDAQSLYQQGIALMRQKQYEGALKQFDAAITLDSKFAKAYGSRSATLYRIGRFRESLEDASVYQKLAPSECAAYIALANANEGLDLLDEALANCAKAISINPTFPDAYLVRARVEMKQNKYEQAVADAGRAIALHPNYDRAFEVRAQAYEKLGKLELAAADQARAKQICKQRDDSIGNNFGDSINRINALISAREFGQAEVFLREFIKKSPRDPVFLQSLSGVLVAQEKYAEAENILRDLAKGRADPVIHYALGNVLFEQGKYSESITYLEKGIKSTAGMAYEPNAWAHLAQAYERCNNYDRAVASFLEVVHRFPNSPSAAWAKKWIDTVKEQQQFMKLAASCRTTASDYFTSISKDGAVRWLPEKMPLKVFVEDETEATKTAKYRTSFRTALHNALKEWEQASGGLVSFSTVTSPEKADIECYWVDPLNYRGKLAAADEAGHCEHTCSHPGGMLHAKVILLTNTHGFGFSSVQMHGISLHEVGHALGLLGHSPFPDDQMFFCENESQRGLSQRDINTMRHLYRRDYAIENKSTPKAISKEAH